MARPVYRVLSRVTLLSLFLIAVWFVGKYSLEAWDDRKLHPVKAAAAAETPTAFPVMDELPEFDLTQTIVDGISRVAELHTTVPTRPRYDVSQYTVEEGDTVFAIAEKFGLQTDTILWGNYYQMGGNIDVISPGMVLNILPVDGIYHQWSDGEGLNGVAKFYHVTPEDIINWPGNNLTVASVGDFSKPNIAAGTMLVIPGGWRSADTVGMAVEENTEAPAKSLGSDYCTVGAGGARGTGTFVWPSTDHTISGYTYSNSHPGIDIAGATGNPVYAADSGQVIYSGWSNYGYGYIVVLDHNNGWTTYYAHLSAIYVGCGSNVTQGATIGGVGSTGNSTGPHLHFEMHLNGSKVNPLSMVQ